MDTYNCYLDFETKSRADIKKVGAAIYCEDPSTDVNCLAFLDSREMKPRLLAAPFPWKDWQLTTLWQRNDICNNQWVQDVKALYFMALDPNCIFVAHNVAFDRRIWQQIMVKKFGFPDIPLNRWKDTMAKCFARGLPGSLEFVAKILNLQAQKDMEGNKAMQVLMKPMAAKFQQMYGQEFWTPDLVPDLFQKMYDYCILDLLTMIELDSRLRDLDPQEQTVWECDYEMNERGIYIDLEAIKTAQAIIAVEKRDLQAKFQEIAGFNPSQRTLLLPYLQKEYNLPITNTRKDTLANVRRGEVSQELDDLLGIVSEANKSSLAKITTLLKCCTDNGLVRDLIQYHAAHTGRAGGRRFQPQNLPRPKVPSDFVIVALKNHPYWFFKAMFPQTNTALSSGLRGFVIPHPGDRMITGDLKQMEKVVLAWLSGNQRVIDEYIADIDGYSETASLVFGRKITKKENPEERQVGKVSELAAQYGGGIGSFVTMSAAYDFDLNKLPALILPTADNVELKKGYHNYHKYYLPKYKKSKDGKAGVPPISWEVGVACDVLKQRWRKTNPATVAYWGRLEEAAIAAVKTKQPQYHDGLVWFMHREFLVCKLHSGRHIYYPFPKIGTERDEDDEDDYGKEKLTYCRLHPSNKKLFIRVGTYGGKLAENITQAEQREILAIGCLRLRHTVYKVILHVHDEWVCSVKKGVGTVEEFKKILEEPIACYPGLPIKVDVDECVRYRKAA